MQPHAGSDMGVLFADDAYNAGGYMIVLLPWFRFPTRIDR